MAPPRDVLRPPTGGISPTPGLTDRPFPAAHHPIPGPLISRPSIVGSLGGSGSQGIGGGVARNLGAVLADQGAQLVELGALGNCIALC